ncbi:transposable element Tcb2 transposase [Trichonephila clavipes]|uniref:Transposable element Tcb2 transposase n=1 Tax=Trichonephila clavipes TaxID=2585209 RepID=A0A8X6RY65_TRICX|nr:transposable element Tcb2 transposase [Trichonephila clavipes]
MNQVVFSDESRFNLSSDDTRVHVWSFRGERLNPVFTLQRHTAPTAGMMHIWDHLRWSFGHPTSLVELERRLLQLGNEISEVIIRNFYASMPARMASYIRARGGQTEY